MLSDATKRFISLPQHAQEFELSVVPTFMHWLISSEHICKPLASPNTGSSSSNSDTTSSACSIADFILVCVSFVQHEV